MILKRYVDWKIPLLEKNFVINRKILLLLTYNLFPILNVSYYPVLSCVGGPHLNKLWLSPVVITSLKEFSSVLSPIQRLNQYFQL